MQKNIIRAPALKLLGLSAKTSNQKEMDPKTAVIGKTFERFFSEKIGENLPSCCSDSLFAVYTEYESDFNGSYTYFLGVEVSDFDSVPKMLSTLLIPAQTYTQFTTEPGAFPNVVIKAWENIWKMDKASLGGERAYLADLEIYDARSHNPQQAIIDILIGLKHDSL